MRNKIFYVIRISVAGIILLLSILAISGLLYPIKIFNIEFSALLQRVLFNFSISSLILFCILIGLTLIFGRFYCSTICPLGIFQEFVSLLIYKKNNEPRGNYIFKYIISGITIGALIGGSALLIRHIDNFAIFGSAASLTIYGLIITAIILTIVFFKNRFFCTNICPVGAIIGFLSKFAPNKIYMSDECISCGMCERNCPAGCIDASENIVDNEMCLKCFKCIEVCPKDAMKYGIKPKQEIKFNINRREAIRSIALLATLGAGYALGINLAKKAVKSVQNIIFPAGAENSARMQTKCLNCNLCINNCPNKILSKADNNSPTIYINYEKGKKYCEYNCKECSNVCPSGAIKKISLEEKQNTRIAMAVIDQNCAGCGHCVDGCPKKAITLGRIAEIDGSKCIGCGKCKLLCPYGEIKIFAVNKQTII